MLIPDFVSLQSVGRSLRQRHADLVAVCHLTVADISFSTQWPHLPGTVEHVERHGLLTPRMRAEAASSGSRDNRRVVDFDEWGDARCGIEGAGAHQPSCLLAYSRRR